MIKQVFVLLAIILPASASMGTVFLTCSDLGDGVVELSSDYWVYPGSIYIDKYGEVVDLGSLVADPNMPSTLGGLGTSGMTIEMGGTLPPR